MGLCEEVDKIDKSNIYGVMPYVAPEVLRGSPYTQAADIYSFGMIMYFAATGRQPFDNRAHDEFLAIDICKGIRPEINESEVPKCYIDLMKKCWDSDPKNRKNSNETYELILKFRNLYVGDIFMNTGTYDNEIEKQFEKAEEYRKASLMSNHTNKNNQPRTHPQAVYTSRLLNPFTKELQKYDNTDCLDCSL
jgi:serine/threonine protein kinase